MNPQDQATFDNAMALLHQQMTDLNKQLGGVLGNSGIFGPNWNVYGNATGVGSTGFPQSGFPQSSTTTNPILNSAPRPTNPGPVKKVTKRKPKAVPKKTDK